MTIDELYAIATAQQADSTDDNYEAWITAFTPSVALALVDVAIVLTFVQQVIAINGHLGPAGKRTAYGLAFDKAEAALAPFRSSP